VDDDGYADVLVGTPFWANPEDGEGAFLVYLGGPPAACENGIDDDGDASVDLSDPGCTSRTDEFEETDFGDGALHAISTTVADGVLARDGTSAAPTTVEVAAGGQIGGDLRAVGHSRVRVAGGSISGNVIASDDAEAEIVGGTLLAGLLANGQGHATISGGFIASIFARDTSRVDLQGTGWNLPLGDIAAVSGTLTGTLADGTPISATFQRDAGATIHLAPEPGALLLAATSWLALGGLARRRRSLQPVPALRYPRSS
jgi:energy-converting hydrogenase Eha subunit B